MRHPAWAATTAFVLVLAGCAMDEAVHGSGDLAGSESYDSGKADEANAALSAQLTAKYGLRPRRYNGLFNGSNEAEYRFEAELPWLTAAMNDRAAARGLAIRFTQAELATNFISEGGFLLLDGNISDTEFEDLNGNGVIEGNEIFAVIDGFTYLGTDTPVANAAALAPWLSADLRALLADPRHHFDVENELGQTVTSVWVYTIEQGMELNAAMFAWSRALAAAAIERAGTRWADVVPEARFFWSTMWFNTGGGFASGQLRDHGVHYWKTKWTSGDDHVRFSRYARYNALWRTSSWEFMQATVLAGQN